jgi:hypothetical protein
MRLQRFWHRSHMRSAGTHENVMTDIAPCAIIEPPPGGGSSGSGAGERLCGHPPHRQGGEGCNLAYLPLFPGMRA